jgi:hypothetical protein
LASILTAQGKLGDETRELCERCLATAIKNCGPDGLKTAIGHFHSGVFYHKLARVQTTVDLVQKQLLLAKSHIEVAL